MKDVLSNIPVDALRVFETAARLNSFTRAADQLGMTQAAVSWRIRDLEDRLGHTLFVRRPRAIELTEHGERLNRAAGEAMNLLRRAVRDVMELDNNVLSITTLQTIATQWLATRLGQFQLANPDLAVKVTTGNTLSNLSGDGMDIGLRYGEGRYSGIESRLLMPAVFTPLCSPDMAKTLKLSSPEDLLRAPLIGQAIEWDEWFKVAGVERQSPLAPQQLFIENQGVEVSAAISGTAVALGSPLLYAREIALGLLVQPFEQTVQLGAGYWLCYPENRRAIPKIARFRDWALETTRADPRVAKLCREHGIEIGQRP